MTGDTYSARISRRDGRALYMSAEYPTREDAARDAFAARPKAKECSTARQSYFDIRWHRRDQIEEGEPC
jgi:hypothetical protein